jgi:hypothetical protein
LLRERIGGQQEWDDMNDYADAKSSFIDEIVART